MEDLSQRRQKMEYRLKEISAIYNDLVKDYKANPTPSGREEILKLKTYLERIKAGFAVIAKEEFDIEQKRLADEEVRLEAERERKYNERPDVMRRREKEREKVETESMDKENDIYRFRQLQQRQLIEQIKRYDESKKSYEDSIKKELNEIKKMEKPDYDPKSIRKAYAIDLEKASKLLERFSSYEPNKEYKNPDTFIYGHKKKVSWTEKQLGIEIAGATKELKRLTELDINEEVRKLKDYEIRQQKRWLEDSRKRLQKLEEEHPIKLQQIRDGTESHLLHMWKYFVKDSKVR